jgi:hypothetical protein
LRVVLDQVVKEIVVLIQQLKSWPWMLRHFSPEPVTRSSRHH